jgi:hypothetical protein
MSLSSLRRSLRFAAFLGLAGGLTGPASASVLPFTGTFALTMAYLPLFGFRDDPIGTIALTGSGVASVNGSAAGVHLSSLQLGGGTFAGQTAVPITDPGAAPINGLYLSLVGNNPGAFTGFSGGTPGGVMGMNGTAVLCLFSFFGTIPCRSASSRREETEKDPGSQASCMTPPRGASARAFHQRCRRRHPSAASAAMPRPTSSAVVGSGTRCKVRTPQPCM